jgi:hypothetical protein
MGLTSVKTKGLLKTFSRSEKKLPENSFNRRKKDFGI